MLILLYKSPVGTTLISILSLLLACVCRKFFAANGFVSIYIIYTKLVYLQALPNLSRRSNWLSNKANLGDGQAVHPKQPPPRRFNMDHINRLASPRHYVPKYENPNLFLNIPRYPNVDIEHIKKITNYKKSPSLAVSKLKQPTLSVKIGGANKPLSPDESAVPRPSNFVVPSIIEAVNQPKPIVASDLSLKMGCGDSAVLAKVKASGEKARKNKQPVNMNRIVTLSQPKVIKMSPDKCNPYKVAKSATKPLSVRRARHVEQLSQLPKRKAHMMSRNKKKVVKAASKVVEKKKFVSI